MKGILFALALASAQGRVSSSTEAGYRATCERCSQQNQLILIDRNFRELQSKLNGLPLTTAPGFYRPFDQHIPKAVQEAAKSVFSVEVISDLEEAETADLEEFIAEMKSQKLGDEVYLLKVLEAFVEDCKQKRQTTCLVPNERTQRSGSAFPTYDGTALWTNAHVVEALVKSEQKKGVSLSELTNGKKPVYVFIFDSKKNIVLNPLKEKVTFRNLPESTGKIFNYRPERDFASLQLPRPIAKPLKIRTTKPKPGEVIYVIGYPRCTGCETEPKDKNNYSRYPHPDSDGQSLRVTYGHTIPTTVENLKDTYTVVFEKVRDQNAVILSTNDGREGLSGSPAVTKDGEVVGIFHAGNIFELDVDNKKIITHQSASVRPPEWERLTPALDQVRASKSSQSR